MIGSSSGSLPHSWMPVTFLALSWASSGLSWTRIVALAPGVPTACHLQVSWSDDLMNPCAPAVRIEELRPPWPNAYIECPGVGFSRFYKVSRRNVETHLLDTKLFESNLL